MTQSIIKESNSPDLLKRKDLNEDQYFGMLSQNNSPRIRKEKEMYREDLSFKPKINNKSKKLAESQKNLKMKFFDSPNKN